MTNAMASTENIIVFSLALLSNALGSVLLKKGASRQPHTVGVMAFTVGILCSKEVMIGLLLQMGAVIGWLVFVSRSALSFAFPLSSITNVTILVASHYLLQEKVSPRRWGGVALILSGIALIANA